MRFAGLGERALGYLGQVLVPRNDAGKISKAGMALEYGGNALAALFSGAAFGGGDTGDSVGIGLEDLGIGLLGSVGGRVAGDLVGRKLLKLEDHGHLDMARLAGSMPLEMAVGFGAPRPILEGVLHKQEEARAAQTPAPAAQAPGAPAQGGFTREQFGASPLDLPQNYGSGGGVLPQRTDGEVMFARFLASQPKDVQDLVLQSMQPPQQ